MSTKKRQVGVILTDTQKKKRYKGSGLASEVMVEPEDSLWLPCRVPAINYLLGGGVPYGKILELFGSESSGKTLLAMDFGSVAQSMGGIVLFNDAEQAFDLKWSTLNGLDPTKTELYCETTIEHISDWVLDMAVTYRSRLSNNEPIVFIQDSIAALDTTDNIGSSQVDSKAEMGNRAKAIYKMVRTKNEALHELGVISIFINQIRQKVGASKWEDPDTTPGGAAMKFFASQRIGLYGGKHLKAKIGKVEDFIGRAISIRVKKNKVAPPRATLKGMEVYFNSDYGKVGFNKYSGLLQILESLGVLTVSRGSIKFRDRLIARGEDSFYKVISEDDSLRKILLRKSRINTPSKLRHRLEKLSKADENRYYIDAKKLRRDIEISNDDEEDEE